MISHRDLVFNPDDYKPLSSFKSVRNLPNKPDFTNVNIIKLFLSKSNMNLMINNIYRTSRENGHRSSLDTFRLLVPKLAVIFNKENNLNEYEVAEYSATGQTNWVELLRTINNDFTKYCYKYLKWNIFVPTREWVEVGPADNRVQKKYHEMTAADVPTLDVWREQEVQRYNSLFRNNNKIPFWQYTMHNRHYDRNNEGLTHNNADRASLETPVYGYDMKNINKALDKWTSTGWYGM